MENNTAIANFNVTFGENEEPMLTHFRDIILPAFNSGIKRETGSGEKKDKYYFVNSRVADVDGEEVFTGQLVKDTELEVKSKIVNEELVPTDEHYPAAPYSVFYIFLRNHRMILIRNQKGSPDLRSFRVTANTIIGRYIKRINAADDCKTILPEANVEVIGIPTLETWNNIFKQVKKVRSLELRFFPLNGDKNFNPVVDALTGIFLKETMAKQGRLKVGLCDSIEGVKNIVSNLDGIMEPTVVVDFEERKKAKIQNNTIQGNHTINLDEHGINDPEMVVPLAKQLDSIRKVSDENQKIYNIYKNGNPQND